MSHLLRFGTSSTRAGGQDDVSSNKLRQIIIIIITIIIFSSLREGTSGIGLEDVFRSAADGICGCAYTYAQGR